MFAQLDFFLCHLAHDVKKLFSVRGKLAISSDLSSNLSDTQKTARLESTRKINHKFDLQASKKQIVFHLVSVSASQKQSFRDIKQLAIAQHLSTTRNEVYCTILLLLGGQNDTI